MRVINFIKENYDAVFIFVAMGFLIFFISGCSMSKPSIVDDYVGMSKVEKYMKFNLDSCFYAQQFIDVDLRCNDILKENGKVINILNFNYLKDSEQLPLLYDQNGSHIMTFDGFFKLVK